MPTYDNTGTVSYTIGKPARVLAPGQDGFETPLILDHLDGVTRTADTPRFNLLRDRHDLTFAGAGRQTVSFTDPHLVKAVLISSSMAVDMFLGDAANTPGKRLLANHEYFLVPNGLVEALVFDAAVAGAVVVEEVGPASASESNDGTGVTFGGEGVTFGGQGVTW
jgi:hypothetical protein